MKRKKKAPFSSKEIVQGLLNSEDRIFQYLVEVEFPKFLGAVINKSQGDGMDETTKYNLAYDIFMDAILEAKKYMASGHYTEQGKALPFIRTIAYNKINGYWINNTGKRNSGETPQELDENRENLISKDTAKILKEFDEQKAMKEIISKLPYEDQELLWRYSEYYPQKPNYREIAILLGKAEETTPKKETDRITNNLRIKVMRLRRRVQEQIEARRAQFQKQ